MKNLDKRLAQAVRHFWRTRTKQDRAQGSKTGRRDYGNRTAATGGKHLDGFCGLVAKLLVESGLPSSVIYRTSRAGVTLPGFFRPTKQWDIVLVAGETLLAAVEFKSLCGPSFANNYNNRVEEAVGNATDLWTAYREGAFQASPRPFLGYVLLLEEADSSLKPVRVSEKHFGVFSEYKEASYALRCEETLRRLIRERCYDGACLILSGRKPGARGVYKEPAADLAFRRFAEHLCHHAAGAYSATT